MLNEKAKLKRKAQAKWAALIGAILLVCWDFSYKSDDYIRDRVVKIMGQSNMCSGEQIQAPSGKSYILTAAHCHKIADASGSVRIIKEDGSEIQRQVIAEDPDSDLLLIEGLPGVKGLPIANYSYEKEEVRTFTHGHNFSTYKTSGVLIEQQRINIAISIIATPDDEAACNSPKFRIDTMDTIFGPFKLCIMSVPEVATTAMIVPGSSGGAVLDSSGALVGVVSAGGDSFGWLVPLSFIHTFLAGY